MKNRLDPKEFFTEEEKDKIQSVTRDAESRTIGEIVVMVVASSDAYREAEVLGGVVFGVIPSFIVSVFFFHSSVWAFLPAAILFSLLFEEFLERYPRFKLFFIGRTRRDEAVNRRAFAGFHENGLDATKGRTGVLFFFSLLEKKVWVLADKGIYQKIGQDKLDQLARLVSQGIREDRPCESLCEAIEKIGGILATHFPVTPGDTDELPNTVLIE